MFPPSKPPSKAAFKRAAPKKEEKSEFGIKKILPWIYILLGIGAITILIMMNSKEPKIVCDNTDGQTTLTSFGGCHGE